MDDNHQYIAIHHSECLEIYKLRMQIGQHRTTAGLIIPANKRRKICIKSFHNSLNTNTNPNNHLYNYNPLPNKKTCDCEYRTTINLFLLSGSFHGQAAKCLNVYLNLSLLHSDRATHGQI